MLSNAQRVTHLSTEAPTILWEGRSGKQYRYWIYPIGTTFSAVGGNYIFSKETRPGYWTPIYIGQTADLSVRFDNHHKMPCIKSHGATHIHVHRNDLERDRLAEEADLLAKWGTTCNG